MYIYIYIYIYIHMHIHPGGSKTARAFWHVGTTAVQNSLQIPYENCGSD